MRLSGSRAYYRPSPPKMPPGLVELMEGLTKEVLKQSPTDVYGFCASHMQQLLEKRDGPSPKKSLSLEEKIAKAQEKVRQRAKIRRDEYDKVLLEQQQRQDSKVTDNDVTQSSTLQVPQLFTTPPTVSTHSDKDAVEQNIPSKPIHHEKALESSAEMEISHELGSDICKPTITSIAIESNEEKAIKKDNNSEEKKENKVEDSKRDENIVTEQEKVTKKDNDSADSKINAEIVKVGDPKYDENKVTIAEKPIKKDTDSEETKNNAEMVIVEDPKQHENIVMEEKTTKQDNDLKESKNNAEVVKVEDPNQGEHVITKEEKATKKDNDSEESKNNAEIVKITKEEKATKKDNDSEESKNNAEIVKLQDSNQGEHVVTKEEKATKKENSPEISQIDVEIVKVDDPEKRETIVTQKSNINPETGNKQTFDSIGKAMSGVASDLNTNDQLTDNVKQQINAFDLKESVKTENVAGIEKDKDLDNKITEDCAIGNAIEITKSNNVNDVNVINSNISDGVQIKTPGKEMITVSNDTQPKKSEEIQQSIVTDVIHTKENIADVQQSSATRNHQPKITNDKLETGATGIVQKTDDSNAQKGNSSMTIQQADSNSGNAQNISDEKVQQQDNRASTVVSSEKIEDVQLPKNSENDKSVNVEKHDKIENVAKPAEEIKNVVISKPGSFNDLPAKGVDNDIPTMVTETANYDDNGSKHENLDTKEIIKHNEMLEVTKNNSDLDKVVSDHHQIAKASSSDSNADFSIPSHNTEDDDTSHDEASPNTSEKVQNNNQDGGTMDLETAAITIQKVFRNFLFKSRGSEDTPNDEGNFLDEDDKNKEECEFPIASALNIDRRAHGITRMDTVLQTVNEEKSLSLSTDDSSTLSSAATIIQAHVRGFLVRNKLNSNKTISTNSLAASNSNEPSITSLEADNDHNKNKTILNIHIVPEGENCFSRDESLITSMDLSLDSSPPSSINLHPLGYDKSERRKQLKREDAIQSISPPSNNSGKLSEDLDSVKELSLNDHDIVGEQLDDHDNSIIKDELLKEKRIISPVLNGSLETDVQTNDNNIKNNIDNSEALLKQKRKSLTKMSSDEMDVVTPFLSNEDSGSSIIMHSGEFHDAVLPTRVSRSDTSVVSGE